MLRNSSSSFVVEQARINEQSNVIEVVTANIRIRLYKSWGYKCTYIGCVHEVMQTVQPLLLQIRLIFWLSRVLLSIDQSYRALQIISDKLLAQGQFQRVFLPSGSPVWSAPKFKQPCLYICSTKQCFLSLPQVVSPELKHLVIVRTNVPIGG